MKIHFWEGVWARWGLLVSVLVLGTVLIVASWTNYQRAVAARTALHIGQIGIYEGTFRGLHREHQGQFDLEELTDRFNTLLTEQSDSGLLYLGIIDEEGEVVVGAGDPTPQPFEDPRSPEDEGMGYGIVEVGDRVRVFLGPPAYRMAERPRKERRPPRQFPGKVVIEFNPVIAGELSDQAKRLFIFGLVAGIVMMLVAAVSWVMSRRYERAVRRFEQDNRLALLGRMSAVMAHEIRNPLTSLKGNAQLLAERLASDSSNRQKADRVVLEATRLETLTADLLDFVRTGSVELVSVDPSHIVRESVNEVNREGFDIVLEKSPDRWPLDKRRLSQALTNILRNAQHASPSGTPHPIITLFTEKGCLVITVRDFGEGLPEGEEDRIFDPFFTTRTTGTGLGLSIARRVVELHCGRLSAENHPEGGVSFRIEIPEERG